jgi:hypothetical protein
MKLVIYSEVFADHRHIIGLLKKINILHKDLEYISVTKTELARKLILYHRQNCPSQILFKTYTNPRIPLQIL